MQERENRAVSLYSFHSYMSQLQLHVDLTEAVWSSLWTESLSLSHISFRLFFFSPAFLMKSISAANHSCKDKLGKVMFLSLRTEFLDFKTLSHLSGGKHQSTSMCSLWIKELYSTKWFKWVVGFVWVVGEKNTLCSPSSLCVTQTLSLFQPLRFCVVKKNRCQEQ